LFATPALAQTTTGAAQSGMTGTIMSILPLLGMVVLFYFLLIRPQQRRMKQHREMVSAVKRGDQVVLSSGIIGKVTKVDDAEVQIEISPGVNVKVVKAMISDVRTRGTPAAANDLVK
jgi:preprotein translocase subunit YajC